MSALLKSYLRSALKVAGGAAISGALASAVAKGHIDQPTASSISAALSAGDWSTVVSLLGGSIVTFVGVWLSHKVHAGQ